MSLTVIICEAVAVLPQSSVAVHVLVTVKLPAHEPGVVTSLEDKVTVGSQTSVAVGVAKPGVAGQSIVVAAGNAEIVGAVMSLTVIICEAVAVLPQSSVAVHVLVTVKLPAHEPGVVTSLEDKVTVGSQTSVAVGVAKPGVAGQSIVVAAGNAEIVGAVMSLTVIICEAVAVLPQSSVAVHVLVTVKLPAHEPGVVTSLEDKVTVGSQTSVAVGVAKRRCTWQSIVVAAGNAEIVGAVISLRYYLRSSSSVTTIIRCCPCSGDGIVTGT